ncbi:hypothetical protein HY404_02370 [Candidatus Microgenomates bacterium]|nr:hypothetical protein [Candidatus Microgenomates bacterium]
MVHVKTTKPVWVSQGQFLSLCYHDIFEYPLTHDELNKWKVSVGAEKVLVEKTGQWYHLKGRAGIILARTHRNKLSFSKLVIARQAAQVLSRLSTICFVGISGSLAMNNADSSADIDLIIITKKGTLWTTRLLASLLLKLAFLPLRTAGSKDGANQLCLNLWLDADNLLVPPDIHNLYTAHEVLQVVPLVDKNSTFEKFLTANEWVKNWWVIRTLGNWAHGLNADSLTAQEPKSLGVLLRFLEPLAFRFQKWHMKKHQTRELVESGQAFFHPIDWGQMVLKEFEKRVKKYALKNESTTNKEYLTF